ncbi:MAG: SAM-dependent methyltransferase [Bacteroidota bacterium]|nr:SAM-dependent methyltransferase [Bacteroidota bacterium]MDP4251223.1 SAM-dependent methyltransferase [Bacteroidota bacterium]
MSLKEIIIERIQRDGPLSFHDYMEMCLYHPNAGYYTSEKNRIGETGDFYTSPHFSSLFGQMIAKQLEEMWEIMNKKPFTIVEYGAGPGTLCRDILLSLKRNDLLYQDLRYCIIEKSASMREREKKILSEKVSWHERIEDIPDLTGCIISNELIDNFPVHQVVMDQELMEVFVDYGQGFLETFKPAREELKNYFSELQVVLPPGFRTEVNLNALDWIRDIAASLKKGFVITIDYGHPSSILYNEKRRGGTLMCFHRHKMNNNPYLNIGEQDITTHINFSALARWGGKYGLPCSGFTHQAHFLQGLGFAAQLKKTEEENPGSDLKEKENVLYTLLLDMGTKLKVLVQQKEMNGARLSGLQFAQPFV